MNLLPLVPARSWAVAAAAVIAGLASGASSAGLIALINTALHAAGRPVSWLAAGFFALLVARVVANVAARLLLNHFTLRTLADLTRQLSRGVLATPLWQLERIGIPRILTTLTHDVAAIGWAAQNIPSLTTNLAIIAGCAVYLGWLSWPALVGVACFIAVGSLVYRALVGRAYHYLQRARETRDLLFEHFRTLTEGTKELKLHAARRDAFLADRMGSTTDTLHRDSLIAIRHHAIADAWSQMLFYGVIGGMLFVVPSFDHLATSTLTGYVLAMLYVMSPVWSVMEAWSVFAQARISLNKVRELGLSLALSPDASGSDATVTAAGCGWGRLELDGVTFAYPADSEGRSFVLGPLDLTLREGELVFMVGGNGSGKSTLMKVLTGLYTPQKGEIRLNGVAIGDKNCEWYYDHFSAIFTDFYLFDRLLGLERSDLDARAARILVELELDTKVAVSGGVLSTTELSQGQRKRLALLTAFLEDRPIFVFDEWAADQDPHYRDIFYTRLLPQLRTNGKTVVVVSHDDRYYHLGDRILKLQDGRLVA